MKRALRALAARPSFTIVAIATLALGFGVNAAVFSLTRTVLLRPLPYRDADRLVHVNEVNPSLGVISQGGAPANFRAWRERVDAFSDTAAFRRNSFNVSVSARAEQIEGFLVSPEFFSMLGVAPALGRPFAAADGIRGRDDVVLLSDRFWRRFFSADPAVIGRTIAVDGTPCTIIGVLPADFRIFRVLNRPLDIYRPLPLDPTDRMQTISMWAKLKPGVGIDAARAQLATAYAALPLPDPGWSADLTPLAARFAAGPRPVLIALEWAVAFVLLIACANVANLQLAVSSERRSELAVRQALGADGWRIARDLGGETILLAATAGVLAIVLATWTVATLNAVVSFQDVSRLEPFRIDGLVVAFTGGIALLVVVLFGLLTARAAARIDVVDALKEATRGASLGAGDGRVRGALIVAEVALSIVLTAAALTLTRSAASLHDRPRGVTLDGVMTAQVALNDAAYADPRRIVATTDAILARMADAPAIGIAAVVNYLPLALIRVGAPVDVEGAPRRPDGRLPVTRYFVASPDYFRAVGIALVAGRGFTAADDSATAAVAIVSETFARRFWGDDFARAIGRRLRPQFGDSRMFWIPRGERRTATVVGVVSDVHEDGLEDSAGFPQLYLPYAQNPTATVTLIARARGPASSAGPAIRQAVAAVDPNLPVSYEMTFDEVLRETFARPREMAWLIGTFAALALLLSAIGVYGVMSFLASTRAREIGIRLALGATNRDVVALVVRDAMRLAIIGGAIGFAAAPLALRLLSAAVYGVAPWNPAVVGAVTLLLAAICFGASAIPAWRAARTASTTFR